MTRGCTVLQFTGSRQLQPAGLPGPEGAERCWRHPSLQLRGSRGYRGGASAGHPVGTWALTQRGPQPGSRTREPHQAGSGNPSSRPAVVWVDPWPSGAFQNADSRALERQKFQPPPFLPVTRSPSWLQKRLSVRRNACSFITDGCVDFLEMGLWIWAQPHLPECCTPGATDLPSRKGLLCHDLVLGSRQDGHPHLTL